MLCIYCHQVPARLLLPHAMPHAGGEEQDFEQTYIFGPPGNRLHRRSRAAWQTVLGLAQT